MFEVFTFFTDTFQAPVLCHFVLSVKNYGHYCDTSIVTAVDRKAF